MLRKNIFGWSPGEQAMDYALGERKLTPKAKQWMKDHHVTAKQLRKSMRRQLQLSGRLNPEELAAHGATITIRTSPEATNVPDLDEVKQAVKDGVTEALQERDEWAKTTSERKRIVDRVDDAAAALADRDDDEALEILNDLLDDYDGS